MFMAIFFFLLSLAGFQELSGTTPAVRLLDTIEYPHAHVSIIGEHEWKELQLNRLITALDRTTTSFGRWGLTYLLHPIADQSELSERQRIISFLVENPSVLRHFQKQLADIKKNEEFLLSYWNSKDQLNGACEQFYYVIPGLKKYLNTSNAALSVGVAAQMFNAGKGLLLSLC